MRIRIFGAVCASLVITGCGPRKEEVLGNWTGELKRGVAPRPAPIAGRDLPESGPSVVFLSDDTFTLRVTAFPVQGTWSMQGNRLVLRSTSISGTRGWTRRDETGREVVEFLVANDGQSLKLLPGPPHQEALVFSRR